MARRWDRSLLLLAASASAAALACSDPASAPVAAGDEAAVAYAKGGPPKPPPPISAATTISGLDAAGLPTDIRSDGKGAYVDGVCGVYTDIHIRDDGQPGTFLEPTHDALTSAQQAACGGPRAAILHLGLRHVSDNPHVDDAGSPLGDFAITGWGIPLFNGGGAKINAGESCALVARNGKLSGHGLRFDPVNYPGSSWLSITQTGPSAYRIQTRPWPDNLAWCENNSGISLWHVIMDTQVGPKS